MKLTRERRLPFLANQPVSTIAIEAKVAVRIIGRGCLQSWAKLPRPDAPDMAMSLETDMIVGAYVIYDDAANDEEYRTWFQEAMNHLNPSTVGQYWGDSYQLNREV